MDNKPKSIGDDAQQCTHWSAATRARFGFHCQQCADNFRAPAAQAAATIQAAPVTPFDTDEWEHMVNDWMNKTGIELRHTEYRTLVDIGNKFAAQFATAIQEPVMVAEPVSYADPKAFENFSAGTATNEWMWSKPDAGLVPLYAAPMVAEPEGFHVSYSDDEAVDLFAAAMKAKMKLSREKGRSGWNDPEECPAERLREMLINHMGKGDPVDVGNFAMMLWNRDESTAAPMVADPADVAWTREQVLDLLLKEYISTAAGRTLRNGDMAMFNLSNLTDFINRAATVKALPSESLPEGVFEKLDWACRTVRAVADLGHSNPIGYEWWSQLVMVAATLRKVAPLADKK